MRALLLSLLILATGAALAQPTPPTPPTAPTPPTPPTKEEWAEVERLANRPDNVIRRELQMLRLGDGKGEDDLTNDEREQLWRDEAREEARGEARAHLDVDFDSDDHGESSVADVVVPLGFFAMVILLFACAQLSRFKREERLHETVRLAIERGTDVDISGVMPPPRNDRRRGILLTATGVGLFFCLLLAEGIDAAAFGLIPALIGAGYLIADRLERR